MVASSGIRNKFVTLSAVAIATLVAQLATAQVYVDDDWAALGGGTPVSPVHPSGAPTAIIGVNAFPTIESAFAAAASGATIFVSPGSYETVLTINKTVAIDGDAAATTSVTAPLAGAPHTSIFTIAAANVTIRGLDLNVDRARVLRGINSPAGGWAGLLVESNTFVSNNDNPRQIGHRAVFLGNGGAPQTATLRRNTTSAGSGGPGGTPSAFYYSFENQGGGVTYGGATAADGNILTSFIRDIRAAFHVTTTTVGNNTLNAPGGLLITEPNASTNVTDNTFQPAAQYPGGTLHVQHAWQAAQTVTIARNSFTLSEVIGPPGTPLGIFSGASRNVVIEDNDFFVTPGVTNFTHIRVDSGHESAAVAPFNPNSVRIVSNEFNHSGAGSPVGRAIAFFNEDKASYTGPAFSSIVVGGPGAEANTFNVPPGASSLAEFFRLDNTVGQTFDIDVNAAQNLYSVLGNPAALPSTFATFGEQYAVNTRTFDKSDDPAVGTVTYGMPALSAPATVYVDDDWTGLSLGDPVTPTFPSGSPTAFIGFDAFPTISQGYAGGASASTVYVAAGTYTENMTLNRAGMSLIGEAGSTVESADPGISPIFDSIFTLATTGNRIEGLAFNVDRTRVLRGILGPASPGNYNGTVVQGCGFTSNNNNPNNSSHRAIVIDQTAASAVTLSSVITQTGTGGPSEFGGESVFYYSVEVIDGGVTLQNSDLTSFVRDTRFFVTDLACLADANTFRGGGLLVSSANAGTTTVSNNAFLPRVPNDNGMLHIQRVQSATASVQIQGNNFEAIDRLDVVTPFPATLRNTSVWVGASRNVTIDSNQFRTPSGGAREFTHLRIDTGDQSAPPGTPTLNPISVTITNNEFEPNAPGTHNFEGTAVSLRNTFPASAFIGGDPYGTITFGGAGVENSMNEDNAPNNYQYYFDVSDDSGAEWTEDVVASENLYAIRLSSERPSSSITNLGDQLELALRTFDVEDVSGIGRIIYSLPAAGAPEIAYVDDDFPTAPPLTPVSIAHPDPLITAYLGYDAFPTFVEGHNAVAPAAPAASSLPVYVADGSYEDTLEVTAPGIRFIGESISGTRLTAPNPGINPIKDAIFTVATTDVQFIDMTLEVDRSRVRRGIYRPGSPAVSVDGLRISGVDLISSNQNPTDSQHRAIQIDQLAGDRTTVDDTWVLTGTGGPSTFGGVSTFYYGMEVIDGEVVALGNEFTAFVRDARLARLDVSSDVADNQFFGGGLLVNAPDAGLIWVANNTFEPLVPNPNAMLHIQRAQSATQSIEVSGNIFIALPELVPPPPNPPTPTLRSLSMWTGASRNVSILDNFFVSDSDASDFTHLRVDSGDQSAPPGGLLQPNSVTILRNYFSAPDAEMSSGTAIEFVHRFTGNYAGSPFAAITMPSDSVDANVFNEPASTTWTLANFFRMADEAGANGFPQDIDSRFNVFALRGAPAQLPSSISSVDDENDLAARTFDKLDNPSLGLVDYGIALTPPPAVVYVDDDFVGPGGSPVSVTFPTSTSATFGVDAFDNLTDAVRVVGVGGTVYVANGFYAEPAPVRILRGMTIQGQSSALGGAEVTLDLDDPITSGDIWEGAVLAILSNDVSISDLRLLGDNPGRTNTIGLVNGADINVLAGVSTSWNGTFRNIDVTDLSISNMYGFGVAFDGLRASDVSVDGVTVTNAGEGFGLNGAAIVALAQGPNSATITNATISNAPSAIGILALGTAESIIQSNSIRGTTVGIGHGFSAETATPDTIDDNTIQECYYGVIVVGSADGPTISNNTIEACNFGAWHFASLDDTFAPVQFIDNTVTGSVLGLTPPDGSTPTYGIIVSDAIVVGPLVGFLTLDGPALASSSGDTVDTDIGVAPVALAGAGHQVVFDVADIAVGASSSPSISVASQGEGARLNLTGTNDLRGDASAFADGTMEVQSGTTNLDGDLGTEGDIAINTGAVLRFDRVGTAEVVVLAPDGSLQVDGTLVVSPDTILEDVHEAPNVDVLLSSPASLVIEERATPTVARGSVVQTRLVAADGLYTFGLTDAAINVASGGGTTLTELTVARIRDSSIKTTREVFRITPTTTGAYSASLELPFVEVAPFVNPYTGGLSPGFPVSQILNAQLCRYVGGAPFWLPDDCGTSGDTVVTDAVGPFYRVRRDNVTAFSPWGVSYPTPPLLVELASFTATADAFGQPVLVRWETAAEIDNAGFHLHRAVRDANGTLVVGDRITVDLIPSTAGPGQGATYDFIDVLPLQQDEERWYFLMDIDINGVQSANGPVRAILGPANTSVGEWMNY